MAGVTRHLLSPTVKECFFMPRQRPMTHFWVANHQFRITALSVPRNIPKHGKAAFSIYAPYIWSKLSESCRPAHLNQSKRHFLVFVVLLIMSLLSDLNPFVVEMGYINKFALPHRRVDTYCSLSPQVIH